MAAWRKDYLYNLVLYILDCCKQKVMVLNFALVYCRFGTKSHERQHRRRKIGDNPLLFQSSANTLDTLAN